ncbi:hypothetical protein AB0C14_04135 [Microbispora hainanensis]
MPVPPAGRATGRPAVGTAAQRELVAAMRKLLTCWQAEPDLLLHCYGD